MSEKRSFDSAGSVLRSYCETLQYSFVDMVVKDFERLMKSYKSLAPNIVSFTDESPRVEKLVCLNGTIPMYYRGTLYHIPVKIFLQKAHPYNSPSCFVCPTEDMMIKPKHRNVDQNTGRVYHPYLHKWNHETSNLSDLVNNMGKVFGLDPPIFKKPSHMIGKEPKKVHLKKPSNDKVLLINEEDGDININIDGGDFRDLDPYKMLLDKGPECLFISLTDEISRMKELFVIPVYRLCPYCEFLCARVTDGGKYTKCGNPSCGNWFCHVCLRVPLQPTSMPQCYVRSDKTIVQWGCGGGQLSSITICPIKNRRMLYPTQTRENKKIWYVGHCKKKESSM